MIDQQVSTINQILSEQYFTSKIQVMDYLGQYQLKDSTTKIKGEMLGTFEVCLLNVKPQFYNELENADDGDFNLQCSKVRKIFTVFQQYIVIMNKTNQITRNGISNIRCIPIRKIQQMVMSRNRQILLLQTKKNNIILEANSTEYICQLIVRLHSVENQQLKKEKQQELKFAIFNELLLLQQLYKYKQDSDSTAMIQSTKHMARSQIQLEAEKQNSII